MQNYPSLPQPGQSHSSTQSEGTNRAQQFTAAAHSHPQSASYAPYAPQTAPSPSNYPSSQEQSQHQLPRPPLAPQRAHPPPSRQNELDAYYYRQYSAVSPSSSNSYSASGPTEMMATVQPARPQISTQFAPVSHPGTSPMSTHDHYGRPIYSQFPQSYYPNYQMQSPPAFAPHSAPGYRPYTTQQSPHSYYATSYQAPATPSLPQAPTLSSSPREKVYYGATEPQAQMMPAGPHAGSSKLLGTPSGSVAGHQGSSKDPNASAPGPIPATQPVVIRKGADGVHKIQFQYSRDRAKVTYDIQCNVDSVNTDDLSKEFKEANCIYPRANCDKKDYKGNRWHYETDCNAIGWSLAWMNPELRNKRGLIQRAVDSFRNCSTDPKLRSRRVRRLAKAKRHNSQQQQQQQQQHESMHLQQQSQSPFHDGRHSSIPHPLRQPHQSSSAVLHPQQRTGLLPIESQALGGARPPSFETLQPPQQTMSNPSMPRSPLDSGVGYYHR